MSQKRLVELSVSEPGAVARRGFPLTLGLPFRSGLLPPGEPVTILDSAGSAQTVQTRVMETHPDRSARWMLLDYLADMPPLGTSRHSLALGRAGPKPARTSCIRIRERDRRLTITNGLLKLRIDRARCRPLQRVEAEGRTISAGGMEFRITSEKGEDFLASNDPAPRFEIEELGPVRTQMRWDGTHRDERGNGHFDYIVRLTVYAGNPFFRLDHTLVNRLDPTITNVREVLAELPVMIPNVRQYTAAGVFRPPTAFPAEAPIRLEQYRLGQFRIIDATGEVLREVGDNSMGWLDASASRCGVLLAGKNFWQNYPKAISSDGSTLRCHLIPHSSDCFPVPRGMAKTHTFFVYVHAGEPDTQRLIDLAFSVQRWPMPRARSCYYQESGQLWDYFPSHPQLYPRLEAALRDLFDPDQNHFPRTPSSGRAYGLKHFGDFVIGRGTCPDPDAPDTYYLNNEYDTPHVLAMMFLRTGEIVKWWGAEAHALHMMDIDTCHHAVPMDHLPDPKILVGSQYRHCYQHIGSIQSPGDPKHIPGSGSHTFAEGLLDYYHLTGDRRALDVAVGYARNLAYAFSLEEPVGVGRYTGWALLVMGGVHMVQPDDLIRGEAERAIDKTISQQEEGGGILEGTMHPRAFEDRRIHLCMRGLIKWHQATGDERVRKLMLELMESYLRSGLMEEGLPLYSNWPENSRATTAMQGFANLESLAYAYDLTGDRRFVEAGIPGLCQAIEWITDPDPEEVHSSFQRILRGPLRFMAIAHDLGILSKVPGAGSWLEP